MHFFSGAIASDNQLDTTSSHGHPPFPDSLHQPSLPLTETVLPDTGLALRPLLQMLFSRDPECLHFLGLQ